MRASAGASRASCQTARHRVLELDLGEALVLDLCALEVGADVRVDGLLLFAHAVVRAAPPRVDRRPHLVQRAQVAAVQLLLVARRDRVVGDGHLAVVHLGNEGLEARW